MGQNSNGRYLIAMIFLWCHSGICVGQTIRLNPVTSGFVKPVDISSTGIQNDTRLFITEKDGRIKILNQDGSVLSKPFLDIDAKVNSSANERGLLGLSFHPDFQDNGYFFVHYTNTSGHSTISRFTVSPNDKNLALPESEKIVLVVNQPFNNHNAGDLVFGRNGYLYIGMGDGGSAGDPGNRSQNPKQLLGKMLRIDVNTENLPYLIPPSNPYANSVDTLPEIWAFGLRNPWRISMDTSRNELWIADVGQDRWEEVNMAPADLGGLNYGWRCYEGNAAFNTSGCNLNATFLAPVHVYANQFNTGCSVTGGFVYRGKAYPGLSGMYIYCDFCTGLFWGIVKKADGTFQNQLLGDFDDMEFATFGTDNAGEMWVAGLGNGTIYKISDAVSSVYDRQDSAQFMVYPNPVSNLLTIVSNHQVSDHESFIISGLNNQATWVVRPVAFGSNSIQMDVKDLPSGMYSVRPVTGGTATKFMKW